MFPRWLPLRDVPAIIHKHFSVRLEATSFFKRRYFAVERQGEVTVLCLQYQRTTEKGYLVVWEENLEVYDCPPSILALLSPTLDPSRLQFRQHCQQFQQNSAVLRRLPHGAEVRLGAVPFTVKQRRNRTTLINLEDQEVQFTEAPVHLTLEVVSGG